MIIDIVKVLLPGVTAFCIGILLTPALTRFLYSHKMWKKKGGKKALDGSEALVFNTLHKEKEVNTPRMGGIIIWMSAGITALIAWILSQTISGEVLSKLDFISRNQTWIPLFTLLSGALI
ncbi:MAG: phospho-N-acetylmuramoyl-pentapeptide-transferase, phospho-N-acetylmuramoyl-pentapeptide-transferase, partial [Candidatus Parcubacteria bacterium]